MLLPCPSPCPHRQLLLRPYSAAPRHTTPPSASAGSFNISVGVNLHETRKRTPQFPGSLQTPPFTQLEPYRIEDGDDVEGAIAVAVDIRRKVAVDILKDEMRRPGKFGMTYAENLVARAGGFIDWAVVQAVTLKRDPEFSERSFNSRVRSVICDSGVVPLIRWLKHNELSYNHIGKILCISRGNLESVTRVAEWLKSIHVKGRFLGVVFVKVGDIILQRTDDELEEIVQYLEVNGVRRDWMGYVMCRAPLLLCCSMDELKSRVGFYLDMGMNEKDFGTMVYDYPWALGGFTIEEMNQQVNYLKEFGLSNEELGRLLAFKPHLMGSSIENRLKPLVKFLYYLGIHRDGMKRMLMVKPIVFCLDLEAVVAPKVRFFRDIGIRDNAIGDMLVKFPPLLTYDLKRKIQRVVIFLITKAGVNEKDVAKVVAFTPQLLGCSITHKLEINFKYFISLGIRVKQLGEMITDFPMLLLYNPVNLQPKYRYLRRTMIRPLQDVVEFPRFFSYSLESRIMPRHKVLVESRLNMKLRNMLACTDEEFEQKVRDAIERRRQFESRVSNETALNLDADAWSDVPES
ncbi:hypothetical protein MLD38_013847 [Melastoma candidum]|uniref:Uncharacterized protein n=1 Tax=Melastoma candidum TaxID=119954 RepID=A0ACB9RB11_9MYRT|nr:hypothetical protein MLD38_013847 [Melastoma candidum]